MNFKYLLFITTAFIVSISPSECALTKKISEGQVPVIQQRKIVLFSVQKIQFHPVKFVSEYVEIKGKAYSGNSKKEITLYIQTNQVPEAVLGPKEPKRVPSKPKPIVKLQDGLEQFLHFLAEVRQFDEPLGSGSRLLLVNHQLNSMDTVLAKLCHRANLLGKLTDHVYAFGSWGDVADNRIKEWSISKTRNSRRTLAESFYWLATPVFPDNFDDQIKSLNFLRITSIDFLQDELITHEVDESGKITNVSPYVTTYSASVLRPVVWFDLKLVRWPTKDGEFSDGYWIYAREYENKDGQKYSAFLADTESSRDVQESPKNDQESPKTDQESPKTDQESPLADQKSPLADQKSPLDDQKSPLDDQKSPLDDQKSPLDDQKSPLDDQKSPLDDQKSPLDDQKSPLEDRKSPSDDQKSLLSLVDDLEEEPDRYNMTSTPKEILEVKNGLSSFIEFLTGLRKNENHKLFLMRDKTGKQKKILERLLSKTGLLNVFENIVEPSYGEWISAVKTKWPESLAKDGFQPVVLDTLEEDLECVEWHKLDLDTSFEKEILLTETMLRRYGLVSYDFVSYLKVI